MDMITLALLGLVLLLGIGIVLIWNQLKQLNQNKLIDDQEQAKALVNQVFGEVSNQLITQTKSILDSDKQAIYKDNQNKQETITKLIKELKQEIDQRQSEIRKLEQDRNKKFGEITTAIGEHRKLTEDLKTSTEALAKVLDNNQTRGQWGERIIEDILTTAGYVENTHYLRQAKLGDSSVRPDITLLLPNQRKVAVDVKFPYSHIQKMALAQTKKAKQEHLKQFRRDIKEKINQLDKKDYINPDAGTLDYAIMFVPNEMLFSFINQKFPDLIDEAMDKKIMIVSPFTFLIVAQTVRESYRNFMIENNLRQIIKHIQDFVAEWERFTKEFDKFDDSISKLRQSFDQIQQTRYKRMHLRLRRIKEDSQGAQLEEAETVTSPKLKTTAQSSLLEEARS